MSRTIRTDEVYRARIAKIRRDRIRAMHRTEKVMHYTLPEFFASVETDSLEPRELSRMRDSLERDFD